MSDKVQPGVKIDPQLWQEFREEVKRRRGGIRGHLKTEMENALRDYIHTDDSTPTEINQRLQRIEAAVGVAGTDGGTDTVDDDGHTHAPQDTPRVPDERPEPNAATDKKVRYLAQELKNEVRGGKMFDTVPRDVIRDVVKEEYGFRRDTAMRYVDELISHFELKPHPTADGILCTPDAHAELVEKYREEEHTAATQQLENL